MREKTIRVAVVTNSFNPKGGGVATAHHQLSILLQRKYDLQILAYADTEQGTETHVVRRHTPRWIGGLLDTIGRAYVRRYNRRAQPTDVPAILRSSWGAWLLNRSLRRINPHVLIVPDFDLPLYWLRPPDQCKVIWFSHHNYLRFIGNPLLEPRDSADTDIARSMERRALRKADAAVCPCDYMSREFRRAYGTDMPVFKIPNWFDAETANAIPRSSFREQKGWKIDLPVVYIPSAGSEFKGKRYVFEIVRRLSKVVDGGVGFFLSGSIPADLKLELDTAGLMERVHAPGTLAWVENLACVKACDFGISPTLVENFSMAILEAMAMGLPFAAFDTGGNREIITDQKSGWVVPYLDVDALVERACGMALNEQNRRQMSGDAALGISQMLAPCTVLNLYENLFCSLLNH